MDKQKEITQADLTKAVDEAANEVIRENRDEILRRARRKLKEKFEPESKFVG
jgi:metal-responsive CopG/Arc/MetJ family transcriptional regulator